MALSPADVLYIAQLADLELTPEEVSLLTRDLGAVLEHIAQLSDLDTRDVPPMTHIGVTAMPLRPDAVVPGLAQESAVAEAPRVHSGAFAVPKFVDE